MMEALWVYQWQNVVNEPLLKQMLKRPGLSRPGRGHARPLLLA